MKPFPSLQTARVGHNSIQYQDELYVYGGDGENGSLYSVEVYTKKGSNEFHTIGVMKQSRYSFKSTLIGDKIIIVGGYTKPCFICMRSILGSIEEFNVLTGESEVVAWLTIPRASFEMQRLSNGDLLIMGGETASGRISNTAEIYNPRSRTISSVINMNYEHSDSASVKLTNNKIQIFGGYGNGLDKIEEYDETTGAFSTIGTMKKGRWIHKAIDLNDGNVLISGGYDGINSLSTFEVFNNTTKTSQIFESSVARDDHYLLKTENGNIYFIGGANVGVPTDSVQSFNPMTLSLFDNNPMLDKRNGFTIEKLPDGRLIAIGGFDGGETGGDIKFLKSNIILEIN